MALSSTSPQEPALVVCPITVPKHHPASYLGLSSLRVLSVNHHTATLEELENHALDHDRSAELRRELAKRGVHSVVLVTCNRAELYWQSRSEDDDAAAEAAFGLSARSCSQTGMLGSVRHAKGEDAVNHLFRVACGLESMMLGEHEVMTQVRRAITDAEAEGHAGALLSGAFTSALRCGGRARSETAISKGALSVASSGVQFITKDHDLKDMRVLVLGAGETSRKVARHLAAEGVGRMTIANRTLEHAEKAANEVGAEVAPLDSLPELIGDADAVFVALHSPNYLIDRELIGSVARKRNGRPLAIVDLSIPRAVDPMLGEHPGLTLHDMFGLQEAVRENREKRQGEIPKVESIVANELAELVAWAHHQAIRPLLSELFGHAEGIRRAEIERAASEGVVVDDAIERITKRLVTRLLSAPVSALREGELGLDERHADYLRRMFGLHQEEAGNGQCPHSGAAPGRPMNGAGGP